MPTATYTPARLEKFSGLNTLIDPTNLPAFCSPDCQNVEFLPGLVRTRPGIVSQFAPVPFNPTVNYLKTYITDNLALRMLALDSLGNFYKENPQGTLNLVSTIENTGVYGNSVSQFGREYIAFGDGKFGTSIPRQFDDVNFDRVSQVGPGQAPSVADEIITSPISASPVGLQATNFTAITGITCVGNIATASTAATLDTAWRGVQNVVIAGAANPLYNGTWQIISLHYSAGSNFDAIIFAIDTPNVPAAGAGGSAWNGEVGVIVTTAMTPLTSTQSIKISGAGVAAYNGTWPITRIINPTLFVVRLSGVFAVLPANSGGGTAETVGNVVAGVHQITLIFQTREGYLTAPAPPITFGATGGRRLIASNIAIGPPNVVARILACTAVNAKSFFFTDSSSPIATGNMIINDNTSTTLTFDFDDEALLSGTNVDDLFDLVELGECIGVTAYNSRLFWWGERNKVELFNNLTFDGGFSDSTVTGGVSIPLGWQVVSTAGFLGGKAATQIFGNAYVITGDGATATAGLIFQSAYQNAFGAPILETNTGYSVRVRLLTSGTAFAAGTFHIHLKSVSAGIDTGLDIVASTLTASFVEYTGVLTTGLTTIPADLQLRVYMDGTPTNGAQVVVENIEVFPTAQPFNVTLVRASRAPDLNGLFGPNSYNGVDGFMDIAPSNGQAVRCGFVIRNNLYFVKERSMYVSQDDQANEPSVWIVQEISSKVGTLSARGVGLGDEWAVIAGQDGLYLFDGSQPEKISQEIQPTWDQINWAFGHLITVTVDTKRKRIYILVPFGSSIIPNKTLTLDYTEGFGDPTGDGTGRKWCPWTISGNSMNLILRNDGTQQLFIGNNTSNGLIYGLDTTGTIFYDDFRVVDNFNRANGPLSAPWVSFLADPQIVGNAVQSSAVFPAQPSFAYYSGLAWPNNQSSQIVVVALTGGGGHSGFAVNVRISQIGSVVTWYQGNVVANGFTSIIKQSLDLTTGASSAVIFTTGFHLVNPGDIIGLDVSGEFLDLTVNGVSILSAIDGDLLTGSTGFGVSSTVATTDSILDNWAGSGQIPIDSYWQSGYFQDQGRMDFGYVSSNTVGVGSCALLLRKGSQGWITNIRPWTLSPLGFRDMERTLGGLQAERMAIRLGTNAAGEHFSLQGLAMFMRQAVYAPVRGINA